MSVYFAFRNQRLSPSSSITARVLGLPSVETVIRQALMKTRISSWVVPTTLAMTLAVTTVALAEGTVISINPKFQPDPLVVNGTSGGAKSSDCGNIAATPNQVIQVTEPLPYLRLSVQSAGQPTLLIDGPGGRFCVLGDSYAGDHPEISGYWQAGKYSLYVGDRAQGQHPYTLSISQKNKPTNK